MVSRIYFIVSLSFCFSLCSNLKLAIQSPFSYSSIMQTQTNLKEERNISIDSISTASNFLHILSHYQEREIKITNLDELTNFRETDNYTIANMKRKLQSLKEEKKLPLCPPEAPIASFDGRSCFSCKQSDYFDLQTMKCLKKITLSNIGALNQTGKILSIGSYSL